MTSRFSATGPLLGYIYQVLYALLLLLEDDRDECLLSIERLDDVAFETNGSPSELLQLKHHRQSEASLADTSPDLWKTLRIWSEEVFRQQYDPSELRLTLITTASAKENTIASLLRNDHKRNVADATNKLVEVANNSINRGLASAFDAFLALSKHQREQLITAVYIVDSSPNIVDLPQKIKRKLLGVHPDYRNGAYEQIEGWWFDKAVKHLSDTLPSTISREELEYKISDIAQQYGESVLPIHFGPSTGIEPSIPLDADQRMFVEQLRVIGLSPERGSSALNREH
ncbi:MAG: hypothetical protein KC423_15115 [Anaerolineales bacterium]|nr:hypothetical protein [Anaerolineales bacterium]